MTLPSVPTKLSDSDYLIVGLAHCFTKQDGQLVPVQVLEPVPSAYMEALLKGVPTSYETLYGLHIGEVIQNDQPTSANLSLVTGDAKFCENFVERAMSAARTYQIKADVQAAVPHGQSFSDVNFSTEKKRILNMSHQVTTEDNVKQHQYTHMTL